MGITVGFPPPVRQPIRVVPWPPDAPPQIEHIWKPRLENVVAFRSYSEVGSATGVDTTISAPPGVQDNDILIAAIEETGNAGGLPPTFTAPGGWTEYATGAMGWLDTSHYMHLFWKRASSEPGSYTWSHTSCPSWGWIGAYSGAITTGDPNDCTETANGEGLADTTQNKAFSITTATAGALGIFIWTYRDNNAGSYPDGTWTEHGSLNTFQAGDKTYASPGATGDVIFTFDHSDRFANFFIALKPGGAAPVNVAMTPIATTVSVVAPAVVNTLLSITPRLNARWKHFWGGR